MKTSLILEDEMYPDPLGISAVFLSFCSTWFLSYHINIYLFLKRLTAIAYSYLRPQSS